MKRHINIYKAVRFIMCIVILLFTYACNLTGSIDDIKPKYKLSEETTYSDATKVEAALSGVYSAWRGLGIGYSETLMLSGYYQPSSAGGQGTDLLENNVDVNGHKLDNYYSDYYIMVQRAGFLIKALQSDKEIIGLSEDRRKEIEAEARLNRAMAHFFLLRSFGQFYDVNSELGIVARTEPITENTGYPRNTVQETYDIILADIEFGVLNAPLTASYFGLVTRSTAKALKAKVLLYMNRWTEAADLALEVINSGKYELMDQYEDIYSAGFKSEEVIFSPISIYWSQVYYSGSYWHAPSEALKQLADKNYDDGDPLTPIDTDGDITTGGGFDPRFAFAHALLNLPHGVYNAKYPFIIGIDGNQANSHFILRLAEMYLIYAEAKARIANDVDADALDKLNVIRARAGIDPIAPATKAELLEAIRIEKSLEFFGEFNQPWFDMIRYHIHGDLNISDLKPTITNNNQLILPFPVSALTGNSSLEQNPGY